MYEGSYSGRSGSVSDLQESLMLLELDVLSEPVDVHHPVSAFPNPFTHETTLHFNMAVKANVNLEIFNSRGEKIKTLLDNSQREVGKYSIHWDGTDNKGALVPGGIYHYKLNIDKEFTGRMVLTR